MKNVKHILALVCALMMLSCSMAFAAEQQQAPARPTLSVDGQGTGTATPDMATVTIGVTTQGSDAAKAQNDNAWTSNQIQKAIEGLGIEDKDIQTRNYSFYPNYSTEKGQNNKITGYTVNNSVIVVVRDIKLTGKVIDAALNNGANEINSLDFSASDTRAVRKTAPATRLTSSPRALANALSASRMSARARVILRRAASTCCRWPPWPKMPRRRLHRAVSR